MSEKMRGGFVGKTFRDKELAEAARLVRESMLSVLPEPEACVHEFSPEFETKMDRLFAKERVRNTFHTIRRWAAAVILLILFTAGAVLAVDTEARANFFEWARKVYENSVIYEFFGGGQDEGLPTYELGWVPEGYEAVDVYQSEMVGYSAVYQKGNDINDVFVFSYHYGDRSTVTQLIFDLSKYEIKEVEVRGMIVHIYHCLDGSETNDLIWVDEEKGIIFSLMAYLDESVMLHIFENIHLVKTPK